MKSLTILASAALLGSFLQATPVITAITTTETEVILTIQDDGTFEQFNIEASLDLEAGTWGSISNITSTPLGQNRYRLTVAKSAADRGFYRVIGRFLGTGLDRDGDGLDNDRETNELGTDPDKFDTDGDGFSDATEIALGTDPTDINDFPELASLPAVDFAETISAIEEGQGSRTITLSASPSYTGQVSLSVNPRSSAEQGVDYTSVPTSVFMSGGSATFEIDIIDDLEIRPDRMLLIDLSTAPAGSAYRAAGTVTHVINISDNDAYWSGTLRDTLTERQFRLCIVKNDTTVEANFVSGQSDGLPALDGGASSNSTGVIPATDFDGTTKKESWPATELVFDLISPVFTATAADLPSLNNGALTTPLKRTLTFSATPNTTAGHFVQNNYISGSYQEIISHATDANITHLNHTIEGAFVMVRDVTNGPAVNSPYDPTDD